jgi:hypothetical protein
MSGLVLPVSGDPLKPALKISGENRRRFYLRRLGGVSEAQAEREPPAEILSAGFARRIYSRAVLRSSEPAGEVLSERSESKDLLPKS